MEIRWREDVLAGKDRLCMAESRIIVMKPVRNSRRAQSSHLTITCSTSQSTKEPMSLATSFKAKYLPNIFDRLADDTGHGANHETPSKRMTIDQMKESVARDLEALLNCRAAFRTSKLVSYPETMRSLCSYGMADFVGLSLASPRDRNHICKSLEQTISIHEPRLRQVSVSLEVDTTSINKLMFAIHALLLVQPISELVHFDAMLQPSTLRYSVMRRRHSN